MKKTNKVNPLTFFNNSKASAIKKANSDMKTFKKSLTKANNGKQVTGEPEEPMYSGPFTKRQTKLLDEKFPSTVTPAPNNPWYNTKSYKDTGSNMGENPVGREKNDRVDYENFLRTDNRINFKKGGIIKKKYDNGGSTENSKPKKGIFTPQGRLESKKTRSIDEGYSPSSSVSKTKKSGNVVTKNINTSQGFVPTANKTKTVTDKKGDVVSTKTKGIGWNKALKKMDRVGKNVGRNENDTYTYKKGGVVKSKKK
jgi:hypothetical protein